MFNGDELIYFSQNKTYINKQQYTFGDMSVTSTEHMQTQTSSRSAN